MAATAHECDLAMPELIKVAEGQLSGALLVEYDVRGAFDLVMAGDNDRRQNAGSFFESRIDEDEALDGAIHEESRVFFDEVGLPAVAGGEVEVAFFNEMLFNAAENLHGVTVAELRNEHADGEGLALAEGSRIEAWPVIELSGSLGDAISGFLRNGADSRSIIEHQ